MGSQALKPLISVARGLQWRAGVLGWHVSSKAAPPGSGFFRPELHLLTLMPWVCAHCDLVVPGPTQGPAPAASAPFLSSLCLCASGDQSTVTVTICYGLSCAPTPSSQVGDSSPSVAGCEVELLGNKLRLSEVLQVEP